MSECNIMCDYFVGTPKLASTSTSLPHGLEMEPLLLLSAVNIPHSSHHDLGSDLTSERCTF